MPVCFKKTYQTMPNIVEILFWVGGKLKNVKKWQELKKNVNYVLRPWFAVQYLYNRLQWLARSTAVWEDQGSSLFADGCIYATATALYTALGMGWTPYKQTRSTQPSTLRGTVKWLSAYALSNNNSGEVDVDGSCQFSSDSQPKLTGLVWGLAAARRSV